MVLEQTRFINSDGVEAARSSSLSQRALAAAARAEDRGLEAPFLLTVAQYFGSLAAARCLGRRGVRVAAADEQWLTPARWSTHTAQSLRCPPLGQVPAFVKWLLAFGRSQPGHLLYPSSDDAAWLYARYAAELSRDFVLWQPGLPVIERLLNKRRLAQAAESAGMAVPRTHFVANEAELADFRSGPFPLLIKPQTQVLFEPHVKGWLVTSGDELVAAWRGFRKATRHAPELVASQPDVELPLLQAYCASSTRGVYTVAGFVDETGDLFVAAASRKVLQWPRPLGIGICFETAPLDARIAEQLRLLCRQLGYFGVFEVEFLECEAGYQLIDFNPRFYGEMAFEIDRGLPLPWLVYLAAQGRRDELEAEIEGAGDAASRSGRIYCHRQRLRTMLRLQGFLGAMDRDEIARWRAWLAAGEGQVTDPVFDSSDPWPGWLSAGLEVVSYARHPRAFLRQIVLSRTSGS